MTRTLLFADVAGIQEWIVGHSTELQMVRGGSRLLDDAFVRAQDAIADAVGTQADAVDGALASWRPIARSSGRLSAEFVDSAAAERAAAAVRASLASDLEGLTVTVGVAPLGEDLGAARDAARHNATTTGTRQPAVHVRGAETCDATGVATASARRTYNEDWQLSPAAARRRRHAVEDLDTDVAAATRDMQTIGAATRSARYGGYVAVVCADGNAVGQRFVEVDDVASLRLASNEVHEGVDEAVRAALIAAADADRAASGQDVPVPVNQVVAAGDDLRFVVPAHVAVPFAAALTEGSQRLQACAGVLLCHASLPFHLAHETAEELLSAAKREARAADATAPPPFVALARAAGSSPDAEPWDTLHASPYRADQLRALWDAAATIDASTSSVRNVVRALRRGGRAAQREWMLFLHDCPDTTRQRLAQLWEALGEGDLTVPFPVTRHGRAGVATSPLADLVLLRALTPDPDTDTTEGAAA